MGLCPVSERLPTSLIDFIDSNTDQVLDGGPCASSRQGIENEGLRSQIGGRASATIKVRAGLCTC